MCVLREATPTIAERYAICSGDLRVAVAAFDTLAGCCYDSPEAGAAAARWLSSAHDYGPLPNMVSSAGMEAAANSFLSCRIGCSVINIFELRPLSVLEQFDELRRALSNLHGRNVENRGRRRQYSPWGHVAVKLAYCDSATAATWVPRASTGRRARAFAWRVLRLMPLSEQLARAPADVSPPRTSPETRTPSKSAPPRATPLSAVPRASRPCVGGTDSLRAAGAEQAHRPGARFARRLVRRRRAAPHVAIGPCL